MTLEIMRKAMVVENTSPHTTRTIAQLESLNDGVRLESEIPSGFYPKDIAREIGNAFLHVAGEPSGYARRMLEEVARANAWEKAERDSLPEAETVVWKHTTFYVAAPFGMKKKAGQIAEKIRAATDWNCKARWLFGKHDVLIHSDDDERFAREDLEDIRNSDVLVHLAAEGLNGHSGGRHVELGYALALGKHVVHIGQQENIFHSIVPVYSNVTDFLANDVVAAKAAEELMFT